VRQCDIRKLNVLPTVVACIWLGYYIGLGLHNDRNVAVTRSMQYSKPLSHVGSEHDRVAKKDDRC